MRRRTKILAAVALLLVVANIILLALSRPRDDYNDEEVAMWFGPSEQPLALYRTENWPMIRRPMVVLDGTGAVRGGHRVPYTDMIDNIGVADFERESRECVDGCVGGPWFAFARASSTVTLHDIANIVRSVRARCKIKIVIFDGMRPDANGFPVFLAPGRNVRRVWDYIGVDAVTVDPSLFVPGDRETEEDYWDRTGCPAVNPRRP